MRPSLTDFYCCALKEVVVTLWMAMNLLHPIFHTHSHLIGSRVDLDLELPVDLDDEDIVDLIDDLSDPPKWEERLAPVGVTIKRETLRGRNWTELLARVYGHCARMYTSIMVFVRQTLQNNLRVEDMLPFTSLDIEPDAFNRTIELDYEIGENTYQRLIRMYGKGVVAPVVSMPFHPVLPLLRSDYDRRLIVRIAIEFFWPILRRYHAFMRKAHGDDLFVTSVQLPEGAFTIEIIQLIYEEFVAACDARGVKDPQLVFLLDNRQAIFRDNDQLMKSWNAVRIYEDRNDFAYVVFRDFGFSHWVEMANPSVKKLLDRTIAKVDAGLNDRGVDYAWSHFDDIEALVTSEKSAANFEQKIVKLIELGYVPVSPDVFVRRKLTEDFGAADFEPQVIRLESGTCWSGWDGEHVGFSRWTGLREDEETGETVVDKSRPYTRRVKNGRVTDAGSASWKIGFSRVRDHLVDLAMGDSDELGEEDCGGMLGVLAGLVPSDDPDIICENVTKFLVSYSYIYWREHFLQHSEISEADIMLDELARENLGAGCDDEVEDESIVIAATAAQAYYLALDSYRSCSTHPENFDQRGTYGSALTLTLSLCNAAYVYRWLDREDDEKEIVAAIKEELIDFAGAYKRYDLKQYGVERKHWDDAIASVLEDSKLDLVQRAARRAAAKRLRPLGYKRDFPANDEFLTTSCGHLWKSEIEASNYLWENRLFCGVREV